MSLIKYNKIQLEAEKMLQVQLDFKEMLDEYLKDSSIPAMDKVELTDWLESKGLNINY